ncbi:hypothetical protein Poli38472_009333 [Pythium oligandrum]|uniref:Exocyst complex component Sec10 n=1 Tax=Pythium oligandrum TaxID=41045 RepID=A0A8K1CK95_PYTOL|nr:hypothetical protein Poli38472_009333 [Pythium oligandrum]|eukprot:TMW65166.1 hypothetical protein Poli38472_009333 [Pythium oligandrum]
MSSMRANGVHSEHLETLLNTWGAPGSTPYDAEAMIDELLANTWEAPALRRGSAQSTARIESFTQQTRSMNELQAVLADSIDRLLRHRQVISERIAALEKDNQKVASKFQDGLKAPEQLLTQICVQMEDLEERFTKVSSTAVVIGDKLATLDQERTRVLDTDEMMEALLALNDPTNKLTKSNNRLFNTLQDKTQLHEAARVIKKMLIFSTELSSPTISVAVNEIERLSQTIENDLLTEFSDAQENDNERIMRKCAESLIEYNDKEKVADRYVWNVMKDRLAKSMEMATVSSLDPIQDLELLYSKVFTICKEQFTVIEHVFPAIPCNSIRELLVERLFNDPAFGILSYLEQFLSARPLSTFASSDSMDNGSKASSGVNPDYVRLLGAAYERTCELAERIETLEVSHTQTTVASSVASSKHNAVYSPLSEATESTATADTSTGVGDRERMRLFLNLQLHSLFGSHRQRYFRTELDLLQQRYRDIFTQVRFPQPLVAVKAKGKASKDKDKDKSATAAGPNTSTTNLLTPTTTTTAGSNTAISTASSASSSSFEKDGVLVTPELTGMVYYETLLTISQNESVPTRYTNEMKAALARCDVILKDSEMRGELVTKLFSSFAAGYADEYLAKIAAMMNDVLQEAVVTPDSAKQFFTLLEQLLKRIAFIDEQFDALIAPAQTDSPTQLTICYESKRKCLEKLERSIATGLQQVFGVVEKYVAQLLATTQDKTDFIGSEANMSLSCSKACKKCIEYFQPLVRAICTVLMDENRDRFLIGLCTIFKDLYLQHLQKFKFDPDGACMLLRDVNAYRQIFRGYRHDAIDASFDILHEVANLYALPPENINSFVRDGKLATLSKQMLHDLIRRRWDYKTLGENKLQL